MARDVGALRTTFFVAVGASSAALMALATPARADDPPAWDQPGHVLVGLTRLVPVVAVNSWNVDAPQPNDAPRGTQLSFGNHPSGLSVYDLPRLNVDWLPVRNVTVGLDVAAYATFGPAPSLGESPNVTIGGVAPHVGYLVTLVSVFSVWLRGGVTYYVLGERGVDGTTATPVAWSFTWRQLEVNAEAHLVIAAYRHVAITAGIVAELPALGHFEETRAGGSSIEGAASWLHVGVLGGILTRL